MNPPPPRFPASGTVTARAKGGSDGRIDGLATGSQHVPADIRRMGFLGRDDVLGEGRLSCLCHRDPNHSKLRPQ